MTLKGFIARGVVLIIAAMAAAATFALVQWLTGPNDYNPLYGYEDEQEIVAPKEVVDLPESSDGVIVTTRIPVIDLSDIEVPVVPVRGQKCSNEDEAIEVLASWAWDPLIPDAPAVTVGDDIIGVRVPGCEEFFFQNDIPEGILELVDLYGPMVVVIRGVETPVVDGGQNPISATWSTEKFLIRP